MAGLDYRRRKTHSDVETPKRNETQMSAERQMQSINTNQDNCLQQNAV
jgi:hypothetical protein